MPNIHQAGKALLMVLSSLSFIACSTDGTSQSSSNLAGQNNSKQRPDLSSPLAINKNNYEQTASKTLKSILLTDASTTAMDRAVTVSRSHNPEVANIATGVVLTIDTIHCSNGGTLSLQATLGNTNDDLQIDFDNELEILFNANFDACNQAGSNLTGDITLDFNAHLNDLVNGNQYSFAAALSVNELGIDHTGFRPFVVDGDLHYSLSSPNDGETVVTRITTNQALYTADSLYQFAYFDSIKTVDLNDNKYEYILEGELYDSNVEDSLIHYETLDALTGTGFSLPSTGLIVINGANETLFVEVQSEQKLLLQLDKGNDGTIDQEKQTTWQDLVLNDIQK